MPLTRDFKETIRDRVQRDPRFRKELLREGLEAMLSGDITVAKTILRDYINATVGFTGLSEGTHIPSKSLMRMFGPNGNPRAANFSGIVSFLQQREGARLPRYGESHMKAFKVQALPRPGIFPCRGIQGNTTGRRRVGHLILT